MTAGEPRPDGPAADAPPLAADRPYVDGTAASPAELRAEVARLADEDRQHVDDLRDEVGDSVAELASRLDVKARVAEKRDDAVAAVSERAAVARDTARERPGVAAALVAAALVLLVFVLRRRGR
jgi:hypothetical protein